MGQIMRLTKMNNVLAKTILISMVTEIIAANYKIPISEARDKLYHSDIIDLIDDDRTGLYGESPLYIYSLFDQRNKNKPC